MRMSRLLWRLPVLLFLLLSAGLGAQIPLQPKVKRPLFFDKTPSLSQMKPVPPIPWGGAERIVRNKIGHREFKRIVSNDLPSAGDPVIQQQMGTMTPVPGSLLQNFEGMNNTSFIFPPDPQGDVGPNHYVQVVNTNLAVFSKTGSLLYGPVLLSTIWQGIPEPWNGVDGGDPVILYDQAADRWVILQMSTPEPIYALLFAISQTSDPTGPWYRYVFDFENVLPDYPKLGVWPDGYYFSVNRFIDKQIWDGIGAGALNRSAMLAGDPDAALVLFEPGPSSDPAGMLPSDWDGTIQPAAGEPNIFVYFNDWSSPVEDYLKLWSFSVNWANPAASSFTPAASLTTAPFESMVCPDSTMLCIHQPGSYTKLMSITDRLMFRLQYRNFGTHRSLVTNHTVNAGNGRAGIRWYELRNSGSGWNIFQQGTYAPDMSHRWMGSIAMNAQGDIALGYSVSDSVAVFPSIRYTGRKSSDTPGVMTLAEQTIVAGLGPQEFGDGRWGDYSMMSVDPDDDLKFWYTSETMLDQDGYDWRTRIASFRKMNLSPDAVTQPATAFTTSSARLNGSVNPNGFAATWYFQWGTTTAYGNSTPVTTAGSGTVPVSVYFTLSGLTAGTTYHFRLVAVNSEGTTYGRDLTFIPGMAVVTTMPPAGVTTSTAIAGGQVLSDGGFPVTARGVCWGLTTDPSVSGNHTSDGTGTGEFTTLLSGLLPDTTYFVRAYVTTQQGTSYGNNLNFKTWCGLATLPQTQNFTSPAFPPCWNQQTEGGALEPGWTHEVTANAGGAAGEMVSEGQFAMTGVTRLVSIPVNTTGITQLSLSFRHRLDSWLFGAVMKVQSSSDGINWTDEAWWVESDEFGIPPTTVNTTITHNLNTQTTYIAFAATDVLFAYLYWYIDDVVISGVCGTVGTLPFEEGFLQAGVRPLCWSQQDHLNNGQGWKFGQVTQPAQLPLLSGNYAYLDSYGYGPGSTQNASLVTPRINLSGQASARLRFYHYFRQGAGSTGTLSYSNDDGVTWNLLRQFDATSSLNPAVFDQAVTEVAGMPQVKFRWNYAGTYPGLWAVDSVRIGTIPLNLNLSYPVVPDTACFDALGNLIVAGNNRQFMVPSGGDVTLIAGSSILFLPSTVVVQGGNLRAMITATGDFCGSAAGAMPGNPGGATAVYLQSSGNGWFRVFPNPFSGLINIEFIESGSETAEVTLYSHEGRKVLRKPVSGAGHCTIDTGTLPGGLYLVRVVSGERTGVMKLIRK